MFPMASSPQILGAKGSRRGKVVLKPGHSPLDWSRLNAASRDLSGIEGPRRKVTKRELRLHCTEDDMWMGLNGKVYNITPYLHFHPGGVDELMRAAGADGTHLFNEVHQWVNFEGLLQKCLVGYLVPDDDDFPPHEADEGFPASLGTTDASRFRAPPTQATSSSRLLAPPGVTPVKEKKEGVRVDWHQTDQTVVATFYARGVKQTEVAFGCNEASFKLAIKSDAIARQMKGGNYYSATFDLEKHIVKEKSQVKVHLAKIEVVLFKAEEGVRWELTAEKKEEASTHLDSITTNIAGASHPCEILDIQQHTHNVKIFRFGYSLDGELSIPIGSHVSLKAVKNGQPVFRNYTPIGPHFEGTEGDRGKRYFDILIKLYDEGQMSQCLNNLAIGDKSLQFSSPTGSFDYQRQIGALQLPSPKGGEPKIGMIAAGTGVTPMIGIADWFMRDPEQKGHITMLFANREERDILFKEKMDQWETDVGEKTFKVTHTLTNPPDDWTQERGRVTKDMIEKYMPKHTDNAAVLVCGPPAFTSLMMKFLTQLNFPERMLHAFT